MIKKITKISTHLFVALIIMISSSSCQHVNKDVSEGYIANKIRINYLTTYGSATFQLLMLTGRLEEKLPDDVEIEWVNLNSSTDIRDALVSGNMDIGTLSVPVFITAHENDLPLSLISGSMYQPCVVYSTRPNIQSLDDIVKTDKIAMQTIGAAFHLAFMLECKDKYGDSGKFNDNIVTMPYAEMIASVESSDILSCITLGFPNTITANNMDNLTPILDLTQTIGDYNLGQFVISNDDFYKNNPKLVEILYDALSEITEFMSEHPDESAKILADFYGNIDVADIENQIKEAPPILEISESAYDKVAELMYEVDMIPNPPQKLRDFTNYNDIPKIN